MRSSPGRWRGGGFLTVIANAPNPAGFAILRREFEDGAHISPSGLFVAALPLHDCGNLGLLVALTDMRHRRFALCLPFVAGLCTADPLGSVLGSFLFGPCHRLSGSIDSSARV